MNYNACTMSEQSNSPAGCVSDAGQRANLALLRRVWGVDALKCPRCEGPMKFIATIHDRAVIVRILAHLRLPTDEMLPAPARRWDDTS